MPAEHEREILNSDGEPAALSGAGWWSLGTWLSQNQQRLRLLPFRSWAERQVSATQARRNSAAQFFEDAFEKVYPDSSYQFEILSCEMIASPVRAEIRKNAGLYLVMAGVKGIELPEDVAGAPDGSDETGFRASVLYSTGRFIVNGEHGLGFWADRVTPTIGLSASRGPFVPLPEEFGPYAADKLGLSPDQLAESRPNP